MIDALIPNMLEDVLRNDVAANERQDQSRALELAVGQFPPWQVGLGCKGPDRGLQQRDDVIVEAETARLFAKRAHGHRCENPQSSLR
jgi:hypothetical protein